MGKQPCSYRRIRQRENVAGVVEGLLMLSMLLQLDQKSHLPGTVGLAYLHQ